MATFKTIRDLDLAGKRVLMRVDFNVPQDKVTAPSPTTSGSSPRSRRSATRWSTGPRWC
jgi:hypothetical protein